MKDERAALRQLGEPETQSHQNPNTVYSDPHLERSQKYSFTIRNEGFMPHISYTKFWTLHQRDKLPKYLAF